MKFVIEIEDEPIVRHSALHGETALYRAKGFKALVFDDEGLKKLKLYDGGSAYADGIREGIETAWDTAREIVRDCVKECNTMNSKLFPGMSILTIFSNVTARDAIKRVNEWYETKKEEDALHEQFSPGDEVYIDGDNYLAVVTKVDPDGLSVMFPDGYFTVYNPKACRKTGKHYDKLPVLLDWLKESEDELDAVIKEVERHD